jgi:hypothetical protein
MASATLPVIRPAAGANAAGGKIKISAVDRQYEFEKIRLFSAQQQADRHRKRVVLDFAFDPEVLHGQQIPATVSFLAEDQLPKGNGAPGATFSTGEASEPYAALRKFWQGNGEPRVDICSVRNKTNSWMEKLIELHNHGVNSQGLGKFAVSLGDGSEIHVENTASTTNFFGIDAIESYGILHDRDSLGPRPTDLVLEDGGGAAIGADVSSEVWHDRIVAGTIERMARNQGGVGVQDLTFESGSVRFAQTDALDLSIDQ